MIQSSNVSVSANRLTGAVAVNVVGERANNAPGSTGLNGRFIALTGNYEQRTTRDNQPSLRIECLFANSAEGLANGKVGFITGAMLTGRFMPVGTQDGTLRHNIQEADELSMAEIIDRLMEPNTYLHPIEAVQSQIPTFIRDGSSITVEYRGGTRQVFRYRIATLSVPTPTPTPTPTPDTDTQQQQS